MGLCSDKTDLNLRNTENLSVIYTIKDTTHAVAEWLAERWDPI